MENKKLLVVVDMQNDFIDGVLGFKTSKRIIPTIVEKIKNARLNGDAIVLTQDTHDFNTYESTREGFYLPIKHCIFSPSSNPDKNLAYTEELNNINNKGWMVNSTILKALSDTENPESLLINVRKTNMFGLDPVTMYEISSKLKELGEVTEIEICGLVTNLCVLSVAVCFQNTYNNAKITIDAKAVDSFDKKLHNKTLDIMESLQFNVINRGTNG